MRAVTLEDIAGIVGVSAKTVSRVVNKDPHVSPATRQRISDAIEQAGYRPNLAARSLATARSNLIGIFVPPAGSHFFSELVRSAMRACREHGYNLALEEFDGRRESAADTYRRGLRQQRCDGVILPPVAGDDMDLLDLLDQDGVRYVRISPAAQLHRSLSINADHARGTAAVAEHFWANGHRRFGLIAANPGVASGRIRRESFIGALMSRDIGLEAIEIVEFDSLVDQWGGTDWSLIDLGRLGGRRLLDNEAPPTAIFTYNDELAAGVVAEAQALGISVPRDLSVAGFDDSDAARLCSPALTTARQPIADIAAMAVAALAGEPHMPYQAISCPVSLVVRQSTATAPMSGF